MRVPYGRRATGLLYRLLRGRPDLFPGGDIGDLAINGTVNDLACCGARPLYLTAGFILEEGLPLADLQRIVQSMKRAAERAGVQIVAGDTKSGGTGQMR